MFLYNSKIQKMTEVVKVNTEGSNLKKVLNQLYRKLVNSSSDVTVVIKSKTQQQPQNININNLSLNHQNNVLKDCKLDNLSSSSLFDKDIQVGKELKNIKRRGKKRQSISQCLTNRNEFEFGDDYNIFISNQNILPDVLITNKNKIKSVSEFKRDLPFNHKTGQNLQIQIKEQNNLQCKTLKQQKNVQQQQEYHDHELPPLMIKPIAKFSQKFDESSSEASSSRDYSQSAMQSLFAIQDQLNDAIHYIRQNKLFELEQFLYDFKIKQTVLSNRIHIKWRLLMAYCKENRKQFQRASILYQQVLEIAETSPKSLLVDPAEIHHKLGICYTQIMRWNDGILSYSKALEEYKLNQNKEKYAECINNLGALYLKAHKISPAEQCFLISYQIKKSQFTSTSKKLISSLFNLLQCNLLNRNFEQAQTVLASISLIINNLSENDMVCAAFYRRKGKLQFLKGNLESAKFFYQKSKLTLAQKYPYSLEFGELCNNLGVICLQNKEYEKARQFFTTAISRLNFYYTKDSPSILTIKRSLELIQYHVACMRQLKKEQETNEQRRRGHLLQNDEIKQN